jgi:hypothetical protein
MNWKSYLWFGETRGGKGYDPFFKVRKLVNLVGCGKLDLLVYSPLKKKCPRAMVHTSP